MVELNFIITKRIRCYFFYFHALATNLEMFFEPIDASVEGMVDLLPEANSVRRHRHELVARLHLRSVGKQELAGVFFRRGKVVGNLRGSLNSMTHFS